MINWLAEPCLFGDDTNNRSDKLSTFNYFISNDKCFGPNNCKIKKFKDSIK